MATIKCLDCGKDMSDTLKKCPHCGFNLKKAKNEERLRKYKKTTFLLVNKHKVITTLVCIGIIVVVAGGVVIAQNNNNNNNNLENTENIAIEDMTTEATTVGSEIVTGPNTVSIDVATNTEAVISDDSSNANNKTSTSEKAAPSSVTDKTPVATQAAVAAKAQVVTQAAAAVKAPVVTQAPAPAPTQAPTIDKKQAMVDATTITIATPLPATFQYLYQAGTYLHIYSKTLVNSISITKDASSYDDTVNITAVLSGQKTYDEQPGGTNSAEVVYKLTKNGIVVETGNFFFMDITVGDNFTSTVRFYSIQPGAYILTLYDKRN